MIAESGVSHAEIEVEFDRSLMEEDGLDPIRHELTGHIIPSMKNAEVIAPFFTGTNPKQIEKALMGMIHYNHLLLAPSVFKRMFIYMLLRLTGNYKEMHGLLVNFEANPACHDSTQKLKQLYTLAAERTVRLINEYNDYLAFWGYAASAVTIIVALIGPVFGTLADTQGLKKPIFTITMLVGALGCLAFGLDSTGLLLALLVTQLVAFPFAILFGRLSNRYDTEKMILICIAEYFGLMDICGKGASFLGTIVISLVSQLTGQVNIGVGAISLFFILGIIVFKMSTAEAGSV